MSLKDKQALPLETKLAMTRFRIMEWHKHWDGKVFISNSGGRDSSVLAHIVMDMYPDTPNVFLNTGLEFPEIVRHVETFPNLIKLQPKKKFYQVIKEYGYPIISKETAQRIAEYRNTKSEKLRAYRTPGQKHGIPIKWGFLIDAPFKISDRCCHIMKKRPSKLYEKKRKPINGIMAYESSLRKQIGGACNRLDTDRPQSSPLMFWTHADVLEYIAQNNVKIASVYDMGYERTGCVFCMFGVHLDHRNMKGGFNRFQLLKQTHDKLWNYCMDKLDIRMVMNFLKLPIE